MSVVQHVKKAAQAIVLISTIASPALACTTPADIAAARADTIRLINAVRRDAGLAALSPSPGLTAAAQGHACDSAARNAMGHTGSDGARLGTRIRREGYRYRVANENLGLGFARPAVAVDWWMTSPPHRANLLARTTRDVGIGLALGPGNRLYWVMVSASSK